MLLIRGSWPIVNLANAVQMDLRFVFLVIHQIDNGEAQLDPLPTQIFGRQAGLHLFEQRFSGTRLGAGELADQFRNRSIAIRRKRLETGRRFVYAVCLTTRVLDWRRARGRVGTCLNGHFHQLAVLEHPLEPLLRGRRARSRTGTAHSLPNREGDQSQQHHGRAHHDDRRKRGPFLLLVFNDVSLMALGRFKSTAKICQKGSVRGIALAGFGIEHAPNHRCGLGLNIRSNFTQIRRRFFQAGNHPHPWR